MSTITWPTVGSTWVDSTARTFVVTEIDPRSKPERHVQGYLALGSRRVDYACDLRTFDVVWRPGPVTPTAEGGDAVEAAVGATPLYSPDGKALSYTRRSS